MVLDNGTWTFSRLAYIPRSPRLERRDRRAAECMPARHWPSVGRIVDEFIMVETGVWSSQSTPWSREGVRASAKQSRLASRTRPVGQSVSQFTSLLGGQNVGKGHGCTPMGRVQAVSECVKSRI